MHHYLYLHFCYALLLVRLAAAIFLKCLIEFLQDGSEGANDSEVSEGTENTAKLLQIGLLIHEAQKVEQAFIIL